MAGGASRGAEKELELAQQEAHMEENREKHSYQGNKKLMMETDTDKSFNPETDNVNKLGNPTPTLPPYDPAQSEDGPCDLTTKQPNTTVGSGQLSTTGRLAPDRRDLWTEKSDQTEPGSAKPLVRSLKTELLLTILVLDL